MDGRISPKFLHAGPGYGGSCFPKDTRAIVDIAKKHGEEMLVIQAAIQANAKQKARMAERILQALPEGSGTIAFWGLSFKPETDDLRDAPALDIIAKLAQAGMHIRAYCPQGMREAKWRLREFESQITYCQDEYDAAKDADALVLMTEWHQFRGADLRKVSGRMKGKLFFDLRNVFAKNKQAKELFDYHGVGRPGGRI